MSRSTMMSGRTGGYQQPLGRTTSSLFLVLAAVVVVCLLPEESLAFQHCATSWQSSRAERFLSSAGARSFLLSPVSNNKSIVQPRPRQRQSTSRLYASNAIEQLSEECIEAVKAAHDIGNEFGLKELRNELLLVGVVSKPERAAETLKTYGFNDENVKDAVKTVLRSYSSSATPSTEGKKDALPFSTQSKLLLDQACSIADHLGSRSVRSEHVVLALMGYNYGKLIDTAPIFPVLKEIRGLSKGFRCFQFCQDLVQDLNQQPNEDMLSGSEETVRVEEVVIGQTSSSNMGATLKQVGVDLTQMAMEGKLDRVYGRNDEIRSALRTLGRRRKNNPCLIGEPGVGKTAIAEGIAQVLATALIAEAKQSGIKLPPVSNPFQKKNQDDVADEVVIIEEDSYSLPPCPKNLAGARLISVDLSSLVAGTENRGSFEKRVQNVIREAAASNVILFIDELHNLVGTGGGGDGAMNAANLLKPALSRGELRILGATTTPEYRRYIEKDGALERRFQPINVKEPTVEEALKILASTISRYEEFHGVEYTDNALVASARLSDRYIGDRFLPDKAIDVLDEAGSMVAQHEDEENYFVTEDAVREVIGEMTGIPTGRLDTGEKERLRDMEQLLGERIKGQLPAVRAVAKSIRRARSGMRDARRPVSTFLFCGPTGVGKTELCKALADTYFGQEKDLIRIDMSEYMDRFAVSRMVGAPPGYVGYEEGGQLTEAVRRSPHSVVLFDEMEKAHEDVLNLLLQVMDDGQLTDGKGRKVNFKNTILVMTSNIGSKRIMEMSRDPNVDDSDVTEAVKNELEGAMKPELLNRIDETIVFSPLSYENLKDITSNIIDDTCQRAGEENSMRLTVSTSVAEAITRDGLTVASQFGARPIRRAVQRYLQDTLAEAIVKDFINEGDEVKVELEQVGSDDKPAMVKITKDFSNGSSFGESMSIAVDTQDTSELNMDYLAFGDIPGLDDLDEEPPARETDSFQ